MDITTQRWLLAQLGTTTDLVDLGIRYVRLRSARAVALEVLYERKAAMVSGSPAVIGVSGVVNVSYAQNIAALERQIAALEDPGALPAPGEPGYGETPAQRGDQIHTFQLRERPRR